MPEIYKIYTLPNCDKCKDAKEIMQSRGISYSEVNLGIREGKLEFGKIYMSVAPKLKKDERNNALLPILLKFKDEATIEKLEEIVQGEDIKAFFGASADKSAACPQKCSY